VRKRIYNKGYILLGCFILSLLLHFILPVSLESYEKFFSVFASGTYTDFGIYDYDVDVHFLLFSLYSVINKIFPEIQVYGYVMILYNIISLVLFGYVLFGIISDRFSSSVLMVTFPVLFICIASFQIVNLSTTRIVFISCFSIFYLMQFELLTVKHKKIFIFFIFLFISLLRIDATLLSAIIFLMISLFLNRIKIYFFIPLLVSLSVFACFNLILDRSEREDKKVYYYKELDLLDRNNIDYNSITKEDSIYLSLFTQYGITDANHFKLSYINGLLKTNSSNFLNSFINLDLYVNTLFYSLADIYDGKWLILFCLSLIIITFIQIRPTFKMSLFLILLFFFPFLLCFYISVPLRFIEPYYILLSVMLLTFRLKDKFYLVSVIILLVISYQKIIHSVDLYKVNKISFTTNYEYLLSHKVKNKPIVVESIELNEFFSPDPLFNSKKMDVVFLNMGFLNSYVCYKSSWTRLCNCNPLSLIDKLEYISQHEIEIILNEDDVKVYQKYLKSYWNRDIFFIKQEQVNVKTYSYIIKI
jgi:hypothetical protein